MRISDGKIVIKDARGQDSVTLPMVYAAFCVVQFMMLVQLVADYTMDGMDYAAAMAAVGGIWLWREVQSRPKPPEA